MDVNAGYKLTDVGVIPEDWEVKKLGALLKGQPTYGINAPATAFNHALPVYLRITDITDDGRIDPSSKSSVEHRLSAFYKLDQEDVVFARTGASVGKSYLHKPENGDLVFAGFLIRVVPDRDRLVPRYLFYYAHSQIYWHWVATTSMRSGQPGINGQEYLSLPIPLPPTIHEQEAIAGALSDADALIESLEQLIAKKRQIKQGAMQELLTGKRRLPEFSGIWCQTAIGEHIDLLTGYPFPSAMYSQTGIRLLRGSNIKRGQTDWSTDIVQYWSNISADISKYVLQTGDLVISMDGSLVGRSYARLTVKDLPALLLQRVARIRSAKIDIGFLTQIVGSDYFVTYCDSVKTVTAIPHISSQDIKNFVISLPPTIEEQRVIAGVLSDMDAEIAALDDKLNKARHIKQGMMQELLTGHIRLV